MVQKARVDLTVKIFDQFYNLDLVVGANEYELVLSFFRGVTSDETVARTFTETLFRISNVTQVPVLDLLQSFDSNEKLKVNLTIAYYLNSISNKTVLYGVNQVRAPNPTVARNVLP